MNRMIKLFQQRSDQAYDKYLIQREKTLREPHGLTSPQWSEGAVEGAKLFEQFKVYAKCAELLRKEELNK